MLNWLNDSPGFPVSKNADSQNREAANPRCYAVSPVSRFSRFQNEGAAQQQDETANACEKNTPPLSEPLPRLSDAVAARVGPATAEELQAQAGTNVERLAQPSPTREDVAELDALMVRLCELEPWLAGYLPEMQTARRSMVPASVAESLTQFREYVHEAEDRRRAVLGAGIGNLSALQIVTRFQATATCRRDRPP